MKSTLVVLMLAFASHTALAEEVKGKIVKVDSEKLSLTLSVDNKEQTFSVDKAATILQPGKKKMLQDVSGGLAGLKVGQEATATLEKVDSKDIVKKVVLEVEKKKKTTADARKIVSVDAEKRTITVTVDGKDVTLPVEKDAGIQAPGKKKMLEDVAGGLKGLKPGDEVTVTTEKKADKEHVTKIVLVGKKKTK